MRVPRKVVAHRMATTNVLHTVSTHRDSPEPKSGMRPVTWLALFLLFVTSFILGLLIAFNFRTTIPEALGLSVPPTVTSVYEHEFTSGATPDNINLPPHN